jgi:hypothetical protein
MPRVGFEHTIPVFERAKTVHALHRAVAVMGNQVILEELNMFALTCVAAWAADLSVLALSACPASPREVC